MNFMRILNTIMRAPRRIISFFHRFYSVKTYVRQVKGIGGGVKKKKLSPLAVSIIIFLIIVCVVTLDTVLFIYFVHFAPWRCLIVLGEIIGAVLILVRYLKKKLSRKRKFKQDIKLIIRKCRDEGVNYKKIPLLLMIGNSNCGRKTIMTNAGYNLMACRKIEKHRISWWISHQSIVLAVTLPYLNEDMTLALPRQLKKIIKYLYYVKHKEITGIALIAKASRFMTESNAGLTSRSKIWASIVKEVQLILNRKYPVYLFVSKCDDLIGFTSFFGKMDEEMLEQPLGVTVHEKMDSKGDVKSIISSLNNFVKSLFDAKLKLFEKTSIIKNRADRIDKTDKLMVLPYSMQSLTRKISVLVKGFTGQFASSNLVSMRGIYFMSCFNSKGRIYPDGMVTQDENILENRSKLFFVKKIFKDVITLEKKTTVPLYKSFYFINTLYVLLSISVVGIFSYGLFYSIKRFDYQKKELTKECRTWRPAINGCNWTNGEFNLKYLSGQTEVSNARNTYGASLDGSYPDSNHFLYIYIKGLSKTIGHHYYVNPILNVGLSMFGFNFNDLKKKMFANIYLRSTVQQVFYMGLQTLLINGESFKSSDLAFMSNIVTNLKEVENGKSLFLKNVYSKKDTTLNIKNWLYFIKQNNSTVLLPKYIDFINNDINFQIGTDINKSMTKYLFDKYNLSKNGLGEYKILTAYKYLLGFPFIWQKNVKSSLTPEMYKDAVKILDKLSPCSSEAMKGTGSDISKRLLALNTWIVNAKVVAGLIKSNYMNHDTKFYISANTFAKDKAARSDKKLNGEYIFSVAAMQNGKKSLGAKRIRSAADVYLGSLNNDNSLSHKICFYKSRFDLDDGLIEGELILPNRWTSLWLLFDGPEESPMGYKYRYFVTWRAAKHIGNNMWQSQLDIISKAGVIYTTHLKFNLDDTLADSVLKLNEDQKALAEGSNSW
jgi:hypothetical protein